MAANQLGIDTPAPYRSLGQFGYSSGAGMQTFGADGAFVAQTSMSIDKGGMRGLGLLAMAIAEYELKSKAIDLAQDYYNLNKQDYAFFQSTHQGPISQTAQEAMSSTTNPTYNYDYYASAPGGIASVLANTERQWFESRRRTSKYNIGVQRRLDYDMAVARAHTVIAGWNAGSRYELNWADAHNNRANDRKLAVANIGLGIGAIVRQGMAASVTRLASSYDAIGDTVASIGNGFAAHAGYQDGRDNTRTRINGVG